MTRWPALAALAALLPTGCSSPSRPGPAAPSADRPTAIILSSEPWSHDGSQGRLVKTAHYRLFTTEPDADAVRRMAVFLETALVYYRTALADLPQPPAKLDTFQLADRQQWADLTQLLLGDQAGPYLAIERGGFSSSGRGLFFSIGRNDTLTIAAHEAWHQYTQRTFVHQLPVWLEEGIATYMEALRWPADEPVPVLDPAVNPQRAAHLRAAADAGRLVPLPTLLNMTPEAAIGDSTDASLDYYAQVWALVGFLRHDRGGRYAGGLHALLVSAAEGRLLVAMEKKVGPIRAQRALRRRLGPEAFITFFSDDLDRADREYRQYINQLLVAS